MLRVLLVLLSISLLTYAVEKDYFQIYVNRKHVLLKSEESTEKNAMCFRSHFVIGPLINLYNAFDEWTADEKKVAEDWLRKKAVERFPTGQIISIKCSDRWPEYFLNYKFPEGLEDGAEIDSMDVNTYVEKKYFHLNFPESCNDMEKFRIYARDNLKHVYFHELTWEPVNKEHWVTVEECFPLTTMTDFYNGAIVRQIKSWEMNEKEQYRGSTNISNDYFGEYLDRKLIFLGKKDPALFDGNCWRSWVRVESPRYMQFVFGMLTKVQGKRFIAWFNSEKERRKPNNTEAGQGCKSKEAAYALNYVPKPIASENGDLYDYFDLRMIKRKVLIQMNDWACDHEKAFLAIEKNESQAEYAITKLEKLSSREYRVEINECYWTKSSGQYRIKELDKNSDETDDGDLDTEEEGDKAQGLRKKMKVEL